MSPSHVVDISRGHGNGYLCPYQEICQGALSGMKGSAIGVAATAASACLHGVIEASHRALGMSPKWPILEGDCELPQFRETSFCADDPLFSSFISFTAVAILSGALIGVIHKVARRALEKPHAA